MTVGREGKRSAKRSARGTQARRRNRSRRDGGPDRDGRASRQSKIWTSKKRARGSSGAREKPLPRTEKSDSKGGIAKKAERVAMADQTPKALLPTPEELKKLLQQQQIQAALQNPNLARVYTNGFAIGLTASDISLVLNINAHPQVVVDMTWAVAKQMSKEIGEAVSAYESATGVPIRTNKEMVEPMAKLMEFAKSKFAGG